jgi:hypothetical protein
VAALAGAYGVIMPTAFAFAGWRVVETRAMMAKLVEVAPDGGADPVAAAIAAGTSALVGVLLIGSVFGLPVGLLLAGLMAVLEQRVAAARSLGAWLAGALVAAAPLALLASLLFGAPLAALPFVAFALIGAAIAWSVRHRPFRGVA